MIKTKTLTATSIPSFALAFVLILMTGCAAPTYVGQWYTENLPEPVVKKTNASSFTLVLNEDKTFICYLKDANDNPVKAYNGQWKHKSDTQISLKSDNPGPQGVAQLIDKDRLLTSGEGLTLELDRLKD